MLLLVIVFKEGFSWILRHWSRQNLTEHPKKFFLTENGRGVVDGGEMYNALLHDVLDVVQKAMVGILKDSHHTH